MLWKVSLLEGSQNCTGYVGMCTCTEPVVLPVPTFFPQSHLRIVFDQQGFEASVFGKG